MSFLSFHAFVCAENSRSSSVADSGAGSAAAGAAATISCFSSATRPITALWRRACACFAALVFVM